MSLHKLALLIPPGWAGRNESLRATVLIVWLGALLLVVLTWLLVYTLVSEGRQKELANVQRDLANLARVSEEHASRTLRGADQVVNFVKQRYQELGPRLDLRDLSQRGVIDTGIFAQVGIIDRDGIYLLGTRVVPTPIDLSDREHFRVHIPQDTQELFVSKPVLGRATQRWSIQLTRRINQPDGAFNGVVVVSVDATYFTDFYGDLHLGPNGMAALYGLDGVARARRVGETNDFGALATGSPMFRFLDEGKQDGGYMNVSVVDGVERIYHYRKVRGYPLAVLVGRDLKEALSQHMQARNALMIQAGVVSLLICTLALASSRFLWRLRRELERRRSAQLQASERTEQLNAILELSPDGFVAFDAEGQLSYASAAFVGLMGAGDVKFEGLNEREFYAWLILRCRRDPGSDALLSMGSMAPIEGGRGALVVTLVKPAGRVISISVNQENKRPTPKVLCFRDITRETEVAQMKSEFLATAAHELRTPMASVYGFAVVLLNQPDLDKTARSEFIDIIYKQSQNIAQILDELLDLARIEARQGKDFNFERLDARALVRDILRSFKPPPGRAEPELAVPDGDVWTIEADRGKLRQALLNVLSNAYKYSPKGGTVSVKLTRTRLPTGADQVSIAVIDEGIGMTPSQVSHVCERFFRADPSGKLPGSGLGMSIVREIINLHHGSIDIQSALGMGTSVSLFVPVPVAENEANSHLVGDEQPHQG
jgi:signal transduction histidine kinase